MFSLIVFNYLAILYHVGVAGFFLRLFDTGTFGQSQKEIKVFFHFLRQIYQVTILKNIVLNETQLEILTLAFEWQDWNCQELLDPCCDNSDRIARKQYDLLLPPIFGQEHQVFNFILPEAGILPGVKYETKVNFLSLTAQAVFALPKFRIGIIKSLFDLRDNFLQDLFVNIRVNYQLKERLDRSDELQGIGSQLVEEHGTEAFFGTELA